MSGGRAGRVGRVSTALMLLCLALTGCSWSDVEDSLRFGWPTGITEQAERMRVLWTWSTLTALLVGAVVWGLIFWAVIFYRRRDDQLPKQTKLNLPIEVTYTIIPFLIVAILFYYTALVQTDVNEVSNEPDLTVHVIGFKWNWEFEYPERRDASGEFVNTTGNSDLIPILVLPVDQSVQIMETSRDVIHSFWVPEFLFKRDVVPALNNSFQININKGQEGAYVGRCAELCGTYHSQMNFEVRVVSQDKYERYLDALAQFGNTDQDRQAKALSAIGEEPQATTTYPFNTDRTARAPSEDGH